jgi:hypothetical protein
MIMALNLPVRGSGGIIGLSAAVCKSKSGVRGQETGDSQKRSQETGDRKQER